MNNKSNIENKTIEIDSDKSVEDRPKTEIDTENIENKNTACLEKTDKPKPKQHGGKHPNPNLPVDLILQHLSVNSVEPFKQELFKLLVNAPDEQALQELAAKSPDRYYQAVTMLAKLAGYTADRIEVDGELRQFVALKGISDYEILKKIKELEKERAELDVSNVVDISPVEGA